MSVSSLMSFVFDGVSPNEDVQVFSSTVTSVRFSTVKRDNRHPSVPTPLVLRELFVSKLYFWLDFISARHTSRTRKKNCILFKQHSCIFLPFRWKVSEVNDRLTALFSKDDSTVVLSDAFSFFLSFLNTVALHRKYKIFEENSMRSNYSVFHQLPHPLSTKSDFFLYHLSH